MDNEPHKNRPAPALYAAAWTRCRVLGHQLSAAIAETGDDMFGFIQSADRPHAVSFGMISDTALFQPDNAGLFELSALIIARRDALVADTAAWEHVSKIYDRPELEALPLPRVHISSNISWDEDGERIRKPNYAYDEEGIRRGIEPHWQGQLALCGRSEERRAQVNEHYETLISTKVQQLADLRAERERVEEQTGLTAAIQAADATSEAVKALELQIMAHKPTTLQEVIMLARWVESTHGDDVCYLDPDEATMMLLKQIAGIGRDA